MLSSPESTPKQRAALLPNEDLSPRDEHFFHFPAAASGKRRPFAARVRRRWYIVATLFIAAFAVCSIFFYFFSLWQPLRWPVDASDQPEHPQDDPAAHVVPPHLDPLNVLNGPPTKMFRDNLKPGMKYITSWPAAGWTNDVMTLVNLIYLGLITDRIPVLPPFTPSHINIDAEHPVPPIDFGNVFDVPRLARLLDRPVLEWRDVKDEESDEWDELGCWNVWAAVQDEQDYARPSEAPAALGLDVSYTRMPKDIKLYPGEKNDFHTTFWNLAKFAYPDTRAERIGETEPSPYMNETLLPDEDMLCYDYLYYVCAATPFEWESEYSPAWRYVAQYMHWKPSLQSLADYYVATAMELPDEEPIPPYISVHIRHADFKNYCPPEMSTREMLTDCFAPISAIKVRVDEVKAEVREKLGVEAEHVIILSDERDAGWWAEIRAEGWLAVDHSRTKEAYGDWYPVLVDAAIQSSGIGFVGTDRSTMSVLAKRRTEAWAGETWLEDPSLRGVTRMLRWGSPGADDH